MTLTASNATAAKSAAPDFAIEAYGLVKTYPASRSTPEKTALKGVDLAIPRGSIFGLLGPNGAGKSTFINILAGLVLKTSGTVKIWGVDIDQSPRWRFRPAFTGCAKKTARPTKSWLRSA